MLGMCAFGCKNKNQVNFFTTFPCLQGKVKSRRLRNMLSSLSNSALGPCSSPQFRSPSGHVGSLEARSLSVLSHGHNAGVAALGKVVFSFASEGRMAL